MPTNEGVIRSCPLCVYSGRSDHLKRHIKSHSVAPEGWRASSTPTILMKESLRYPESTEIVFRKAVCLKCGVCFDNPNPNPTKEIVTHPCKEPAVRNRTKNPSEDGDSQSSQGPSEADQHHKQIKIFKDMINKYHREINKQRLTVPQKERRETILKKLKEILEEHTENSKVDFQSVIVEFLFTVSTLYITAEPESETEDEDEDKSEAEAEVEVEAEVS